MPEPIDIIAIVCAEESHATKTATLAEFRRDTADAPTYLEHPQRWNIRRQRYPSKRTRIVRGNVIESVDMVHMNRVIDNEVWDPRKHSVDEESRFVLEGHLRYRIKCPLCNLTAAIRSERMDEILDEARSVGTDKVSLRQLCAI